MAKGTVPRHPPGLVDQSVIDSLLRNWRRWQDRGTALFVTARRAALGPQDDKESRTLFFGLGEAAIAGSQEWLKWEFDRTAGMLFGCAVECWFKGLIVIENPSIPIPQLLRHGHNLRALAVQSKVDPYLDDDDRDYLDLLQSLIEGLGRYPAPKKPEKLIPSDPAGDQEHWNAVQQAIWKRFEALELAGKTDNPLILEQLHQAASEPSAS